MPPDELLTGTRFVTCRAVVESFEDSDDREYVSQASLSAHWSRLVSRTKLPKARLLIGSIMAGRRNRGEVLISDIGQEV
jgi:hypothetical protein